MREEKITNISLSDIVPNPHQPRKVFDETAINNLTNSIKQHGIINPIIVRPSNNKYEIVAGERRYRAAKKLNLETVPVIIKNIDDAELKEVALIENLIRENLTPIEEANAYKDLMNSAKMKESELAQRLGKSQAAISNKIRLLSLTKEVQTALNNRQISERHARSLLQVSDKETQVDLLKRIIDERLTVKELDNLIKSSPKDELEINLAISNIMASLKKESELTKNDQKEEKESDNMNQGNQGSFFPNLNQPTQNNNNMSLNAMNMQSMATPPQGGMNTAPTSIPTPDPIPTFAMPEMNPTPQMAPSAPTNEPVVAPPEPSIPQAPAIEPIFTQPNTPMPEPSIEPTQTVTPLFTPSIEPQMVNPTPITKEVTPEITPNQVADVNPTPSTPTPEITEATTTPNIEDLPLFNNIQTPVAPTETSQELSPEAPAYEIPVNTAPIEPISEPVPEAPVVNPETPVDKLTQTQEFLNSNNIPYKLYNNETGHCIIIEL